MKTAGATARRQKARQEMRGAILDAARRIVAEEGVHALSMRAVARAIDYSPAALYEYFPAKEDVCAALYFEGAEGLAGRMRAALAELPPDAPAERRMWVLGHAYRAYALEQPELYRLAFGSGMAGFTPGAAEMASGAEAFDILVEAARYGVESGAFQATNPDLIALGCWAGVHGYVLLELAGMVGAGEAPHIKGECVPGDPFEATLLLLGDGFMRR